MDTQSNREVMQGPGFKDIDEKKNQYNRKEVLGDTVFKGDFEGGISDVVKQNNPSDVQSMSQGSS